MTPKVDDATAIVTKLLMKKGLIIEAGWAGFRSMVYPEQVPPDQLEEASAAFFAGAAHLFSSIMYSLDPGEEPTDADIQRTEQINAELCRFISDFTARNIRTEGNA
jgi:hypothetical protein